MGEERNWKCDPDHGIAWCISRPNVQSLGIIVTVTDNGRHTNTTSWQISFRD